jgi:hypothetical protein
MKEAVSQSEHFHVEQVWVFCAMMQSSACCVYVRILFLNIKLLVYICGLNVHMLLQVSIVCL